MLAGIVLIILLQNTRVVSVRFLFWEFSMSRIMLLLITLLAGFAAGFIAGKKSHG